MSGGAKHCPGCGGAVDGTQPAQRSGGPAGPPCRCAAAPAASLVQQPDAPPGAGPDPADVALFGSAEPGRHHDELLAIGPVPPRERAGRGRWAVAGAAVLAVAGCALLLGALVDRDRDGSTALPDTDDLTSVSVPTAAPKGTPTSASPSGSPSAEPSPSASASTSEPAPTSSAPAPATSEAPRSSPPADGASDAPAPDGPPSPAPGGQQPPGGGEDEDDEDEEGGDEAPSGTLRRGDSGPAVQDLQRRLRQLYLYDRRMDGRYDRGVEYAVLRYQNGYGVRGDEPGVYGPNTRASLESRT